MWRKIVGSAEFLLIGTILVSLWFSYSFEEKLSIYLDGRKEQIILDDDILWYNASDYSIKLTDSGIKKIKTLRIGVYGEPFIVKVGKTEIFRGAFWIPVSSVNYRGIVIIAPLQVEEYNIIKFELGYPPEISVENSSTDRRNDSRIIIHFRNVGKLKQ